MCFLRLNPRPPERHRETDEQTDRVKLCGHSQQVEVRKNTFQSCLNVITRSLDNYLPNLKSSDSVADEADCTSKLALMLVGR